MMGPGLSFTGLVLSNGREIYCSDPYERMESAWLRGVSRVVVSGLASGPVGVDLGAVVAIYRSTPESREAERRVMRETAPPGWYDDDDDEPWRESL